MSNHSLGAGSSLDVHRCLFQGAKKGWRGLCGPASMDLGIGEPLLLRTSSLSSHSELFAQPGPVLLHFLAVQGIVAPMKSTALLQNYDQMEGVGGLCLLSKISKWPLRTI
ncbi:hypothetical protein H112_03784 [Trichophyton rubrum D6]|uniref:Uncharacterized protein n=3 Tax=Trichophyton TaxID=5550 RepID=A0A080WNM2_TRIRC|nr:uncharacterized protein TERG_12242 [Trichophyton rubrum CBS 118892]EZF23535.1 hypothetical protein H100_03793 [Trichophyton rubrum MR850]EZF42491.1 hypothetical protein H102_03781 [Trichophyton rubrum CBS 100081]EZF53103.1 hypothetical protein H103_03794 [Trichophyton rubrum CBS 288.86]EZF63776.1 hypothetical protein H104_03780 [Trichophyton rubrum CBS 289.86]EZF74471.1 hypothetical protein H105_03809 [Trichophyton soudanense CBS 452.61]EZF85051.1 hypothetical protein H110_03786 [Trichophy